MKIFFYLFIAFSVIHGSTISSHAMMNMTGEVWDYDNVSHTATYSCPRCYEPSTDIVASYAFPTILTFASCCGGLIGSCIWNCVWKKCRSKGKDSDLPTHSQNINQKIHRNSRSLSITDQGIIGGSDPGPQFSFKHPSTADLNIIKDADPKQPIFTEAELIVINQHNVSSSLHSPGESSSSSSSSLYSAGESSSSIRENETRDKMD